MKGGYHSEERTEGTWSSEEFKIVIRLNKVQNC